MDKRCRVCTSKFGIFKKEVECNRCRIALCKDCRSQTLQEKDKTLFVCKKCFTAVTTGNAQSRPRTPPLNFKREMEAKKQQAVANGSAPKQVGELEEEDLKIAERLDKLAEDNMKYKDVSIASLEARLSKLSAAERVATQQEIEYRLAKLKGDRPPAVKVLSIRKSESDETPSSSAAETPDRQVKRLIRQYTEEVAMDEDLVPTAENGYFDPENIPEEATADQLIELTRQEISRDKETEKREAEMDTEMQERLKRLQGMSPQIDCDPISQPKMPRMSSVDLSDEEEEQLIKKLTDEAGLEVYLGGGRKPSKKSGKSSVPKDVSLGGSSNQATDEVSDKDELPWCIICNGDASVRCHGCEGDLYCHRCFKEGHDRFDMGDHKTSKYSPPKGMDYD